MHLNERLTCLLMPCVPVCCTGIGCKKERHVLLEYVWDKSNMRLHQHPPEYYRILFGATWPRVRAVQQVAQINADCEEKMKTLIALHGNVGKIPHNKTPVHVEKLLKAHLERFSKPIPDPQSGKQQLQYVRADVNSERELYSELIKAHATLMGNDPDTALKAAEPLLSLQTFKAVLKRVLEAYPCGGARLVQMSADHNACSECLQYHLIDNRLHVEIHGLQARLKRSGGEIGEEEREELRLKLEKLKKEKEKNRSMQLEHWVGDARIRDAVHDITEVAALLHDEHEAKIRAGTAERGGRWQGMQVVHIDDM